MTSAAETIFGVLAAIVGFAIILYLAYISTKLLGKRYRAKGRCGDNLKLLESLPLGQDKYLMLARAGEKIFLLGVTQQRIDLISELDEQSLTLSEESAPAASFSEILRQNLPLGFGKSDEKPDGHQETSKDTANEEK